MKVVWLALLCLGSESFFGGDATQLDVASNFERKWTAWALSRARRDLPAQAADASAHSLTRTQDANGEPKSLGTRRIRVKRNPAEPCKLKLCKVQSLVDRLSQLSPNGKDQSVPSSVRGFGRRRRALGGPRIGARGQVRPSPESTLRPTHVVPALGRMRELQRPCLQPPHRLLKGRRPMPKGSGY